MKHEIVHVIVVDGIVVLSAVVFCVFRVVFSFCDALSCLDFFFPLMRTYEGLATSTSAVRNF